MKTTLLWILTGLNLLLLTLFVGYFIKDNAAMAQKNTRAADYLLIPGEITGNLVVANGIYNTTPGIVYIIDTTNAALGAMAYNDIRKTIEVMQPLDLARVFETGTPAQPNTGGKGYRK